MKLPNDYVEMGYEAPWSMKNGTKRIAMFISNTDDLDEFWCFIQRLHERAGEEAE